jgi:3-dehydrotetronate 4-kinase
MDHVRACGKPEYEGRAMLLLGVIADDFTGATDIASMLVRRGMRTVQLIGPSDADPGEVEAVVVALKTRTCPAGEAVEQSLAALAWLRERGARQIVFKYCSTFDSTEKGNIGPVAEALLEALGEDLTIACPALPENRRTVYQGHLFVGDRLLAETEMRHHPLTPMTDSDIVRVLASQARGRVGLVPYEVVDEGPEAIRAAIETARGDGVRLLIVDALADRHMRDMGTAAADLGLVTGGSGIAFGLPDNFRRQGLLTREGPADALPAIGGPSVVLSGSCSETTQAQVRIAAERMPSRAIDAPAVAEGADVAGEVLAWAEARLAEGPVMIYSTADHARVAALQDRLGRERAGALVEEAMAAVARGLYERGVRRFVVAGGETSGAVVGALGVTGLRIGPPIDPGVPWTTTIGDPPLALALKSGKFGAPDFFAKALESAP